MLVLFFLFCCRGAWLSPKGLKKHRGIRMLSLPFCLIGTQEKLLSKEIRKKKKEKEKKRSCSKAEGCPKAREPETKGR